MLLFLPLLLGFCQLRVYRILIRDNHVRARLLR
jgi:hypothetical protein